MTTTQNTAGQALTATLRRYFSVGTRTRRYRDGRDMHAAMIQALTEAATMPGIFSEHTQVALRAGFGVALSYDKHVSGYRIDSLIAQRINSMSAWQFATFLGRMVDSGVQTTGDGERYFALMAKTA